MPRIKSSFECRARNCPTLFSDSLVSSCVTSWLLFAVHITARYYISLASLLGSFIASLESCVSYGFLPSPPPPASNTPLPVSERLGASSKRFSYWFYRHHAVTRVLSRSGAVERHVRDVNALSVVIVFVGSSISTLSVYLAFIGVLTDASPVSLALFPNKYQ